MFNPLLHFEAYGLRNPVVQWCIERGAYDAFCPECRGAGVRFRRPCICVEPGEILEKDAERVTGGCTACRYRCRACGGSGLQPDHELLTSDFGDAQSRYVAERYLKAKPKDPRTGLPAMGTRRLR